MIKRLHLRLTLIFTAFTCLVLFFALIVAFFFASEQYKTAFAIEGERALNNIKNSVYNTRTVSDKILLSTELEYNCLIEIIDNGKELFYEKNNDFRKKLFAMASSKKSGETFSNGGQSYEQLSDYNSPLKVKINILHNKSEYIKNILTLKIFYIIIFIIGSLALFAVGFMIVGSALRPTVNAMQKQIEFTAAASHELKSPLSVISASLAAEENPSSFIRTAQREVRRMQRLTEDLLVLAASDSDNYAATMSVHMPDIICIEVYEAFHELALAKKREIKVLLPENMMTDIKTDKDRLMQLLSILLQNALEYTPSNTIIELELRQNPKYTQFLVRDFGNGLSKEEKQKVFDRFYRNSESRNSKTNLGLGLSVAKALATTLGGKITIADTQGKGCTFVVEI